MAWFHDYSRDYTRTPGYNRGGSYSRDMPGQRSTNYGYDAGWGNRAARGPAYGGDRYGYDYEYAQRHPEQSPLYGRNADQAVQRWANRYGYDYSYQVQPRNTGGGNMGGRAMSRNQGGYGTTGGNRVRYQGGYTRGGGYGGTSGGYGGYDQGYRY